MKKSEFLAELELRLGGLPDVDRKQSLDYYTEMIDDHVEDGLSEEGAIAAIGTPAQLAEEILREKLAANGEASCAKKVDEGLKSDETSASGSKAAADDKILKKNHTLSAPVIVLLVLGSPVWLSLLVAAASVVLSLYAVLWSLVVTVFAVDVSFGVVALAAVLTSPVFFVTKGAAIGLSMLGIGFVLAGLAMLMNHASQYALKGGVILSKWIFCSIKRCFVRKEMTK